LYLLLNQFYPPDPAPTGRYLHDLARALVARGHRVRVLCSRNGYDGRARYPARETIDGVEVIRLRATGFGRRGFLGRTADYASFYLSVLAAVLFGRDRPGLVLSLTTPPYLGLLAKVAAGKARCPRVHWIMDLYPDVLFAHGLVRGGALAERMLRGLTRFEFRGAAEVIALGPCMAGRVGRYGATGREAAEDQRGRGSEDQRGRRSEGQKIRGAEGQSRRGSEDQRGRGSEGQRGGSSEPQSLRAAEVALGPGSTVAQERSESSDRRTAALSYGRTVAEQAVAPSDRRTVAPPHCAWFPLWSDPDLEPWADDEPNPVRAQRGWKLDELVLLYSGNMGLGHRFAEFFAAAQQLGANGPRWVFSGGGKRRQEVADFAQLHPEARIELLGYVPQTELRAHLCAGDVGGLECETALWIQESGGGWTVPAGDVPGLLDAIAEATDPVERRRRGQAALEYSRNRFDMDKTCGELAAMLEHCAVR